MQHLTQAPRVTAQAQQVLADVDIMGNPYLTSLADGRMPLEDFRAGQEQIGFAVTYFARPMASLISRMELPGDRLGILGNIVEEHGHFKPHAFHHATFRQFLASIGSDDAGRLDALTLSPQVHAFNSVLTSVCTMEDLAVGISCLGVIEHAFAEISATIGRTVVERGWVPEGDLVHYLLHAEIDERHAEDFFVLVEPTYDDPRTRRAVDRGLRLGAYVFNRLYTDLCILAG
jgi:pyrroloquinoline-quinone synthase